jgi:hypothetical protein
VIVSVLKMEIITPRHRWPGLIAWGGVNEPEDVIESGIPQTWGMEQTPTERQLADDPEAIAADRAERSRKRGRQTVRDMVLSMLVVTAAVAVLFLPWNHRDVETVKVVDPIPTVTAARGVVTWPVLQPNLPPTWRCTSARLSAAGDAQPIVHLGYLSPSARYVGIEQSATKETSFVHDSVVGGKPSGTSTINGVVWQRYESADGVQRSLVDSAHGATYVVNSQAQWPEIEQFARSLVPGTVN